MAEPLFSAVIHGCRAGRQQEAFREVYWRRVLRGSKAYSFRKLGAFGSNLSALSEFFIHRWDQPSPNLSTRDQAFVLNQAGMCLGSLGRLLEAVKPIEAALIFDSQRASWEGASAEASNLCELFLALGDIEKAIFLGRQSIEIADRGGVRQIACRASLGEALHQRGRWEESAKIFRQAEALVEKLGELHTSLEHKHCSLLLSRSEPDDGSVLDCLATDSVAWRVRDACRKVKARAELMLEMVTEDNFEILSIVLYQLILGRAHLGLAMTSTRMSSSGSTAEADFTRAAEYLDGAVGGLRKAGPEEAVGRGLIARVTLRRFQGDLSAAETDLSEVLEIAERGSMRLLECDAHLEWARLCRQRGDRVGMERHVARARKLVEETGYGRRRREVEWLEGQLKV